MIKKTYGMGYGKDTAVFRQVAELHQRARQDRFIDTVDAVARATGQKIDGKSLAAQICRAAAKARGELPPDPQELTPVARAILNAGRKRRNEPLL
jgi:hypothetical protein